MAAATSRDVPDSGTSRSWRGCGFRFAAVAIGVAAGIIAAEGILRIAIHLDLPPLRSFAAFVHAPEGEHAQDPRYRQSDDPLLGWELLPSVTAGDVRVNAAGFRGPDFTQELPSGVTRVAVVGDSETFGALLKEDETLPGALQRELHAASPCRWEVLNFGIEGYNTVQESRLLETKVLRYQPSVVVLYYVFNDPIMSSRSFLFAKSPFGWSYLVTLVRWQVYRWRQLRDISITAKQEYEADPAAYWRWLHDSEYFDRAAMLIRKMARATRANGGRFVLVVAPEVCGYEDLRKYPFLHVHERLAVLASKDIELVDPLNEVMTLTDNPRELWATADNCHKNRAAVSAVARW